MQRDGSASMDGLAESMWKTNESNQTWMEQETAKGGSGGSSSSRAEKYNNERPTEMWNVRTKSSVVNPHTAHSTHRHRHRKGKALTQIIALIVVYESAAKI